MEQRLSLITLGVADVARSRRFYEALGWRASGASEAEVTFFQLGGIALFLWGRAELAGDAQLPDGPGWGSVALPTTRARVRRSTTSWRRQSAGAQILKPAHETFWGGYAGYFADPDGHPYPRRGREPPAARLSRTAPTATAARADGVGDRWSGRWRWGGTR